MILFRNDDILQVEVFSAKQQKRLNPSTAFESFLACDEIFEKYKYPQILVVLSEGIKYYTKWVKHIKKNQWRYRIELHGSKHYYYEKFTAKEGLKDLNEARNRLEQEFRCKITTWYTPYGGKHYPSWGEKVCKKLGLAYNNVKNDFPPKCFHYWHKGQVEDIKRIIEEDVQRQKTT